MHSSLSVTLVNLIKRTPVKTSNGFLDATAHQVYVLIITSTPCESSHVRITQLATILLRYPSGTNFYELFFSSFSLRNPTL